MPLPALGLVDGGHDQVGSVLGDGTTDGVDHLVGAEPFDQPDSDRQVTAGGVVAGVIHDGPPCVERDQLGMPRGLAGLEASCRLGEAQHLAAAADEGHLPAGLMGVHDGADGPGVGAAQHCVGDFEQRELRVAPRIARDPQFLTQDCQPQVRFAGDGRAEPPGLGEADAVVGRERGEDVGVAAPLVEGLSAVAHRNELGVLG